MENLINPLLRSVRSYDNEIEFKFKYSIIDPSDIISFCKKQKLKYLKQEDTSYIYKEGFRIIKNSNTKKKIIQKKERISKPKEIVNIINILNREYLINFAESNESEIDPKYFKFSEKDFLFQRSRKRMSFFNDLYKIDITFINETNKYELELEIFKNGTYITKLIENLLSIVQDSIIPLSLSSILAIKNSIKTLLNKPQFSFPGSLPHTIKHDTLHNISCGYSISDKSDGDRAIIFIDSNHFCFIIKRNKTISCIGQVKHKKNYIYDTEYIDKKFLIFDTLYANKDVRDLSYTERYNMIEEDKKVFFKKQVYFENISTFVETINNKKYKTDGIIFTPIYKNYNNEQIYKWKTKNTIDFFCKKINEHVYQLQIAGSTKDGKYTHFPFTGIDGKGTFIINNEYHSNIIDKNIKSTVELKIDRDLFIGEFSFMPRKKEWKLEKIREDKTFANHIKTTNDAWEAISKPISKKHIKDQLEYNCSRKFHNKIKKELIEKYTSNKKVLNIGIGAGGNFKKYSNAKVLSLVGIDIKNIEYNYKNIDFTFYKVKNNSFELNKLTRIKFDIVCAFFSIHYFFRSEETIQNLIRNLHLALNKGGVFIATFMDESKVLKVIDKNYQLFKIKKLKLNQIEVQVSGTKYFKNNTSKEYLVNLNNLSKLLKHSGFEIIERKSFEEYSDYIEYKMLNKEEKLFSSLHTTLVVKKIKDNSNISLIKH